MLRVVTVLAFLVTMSEMVVAGPRPGANHHMGDDSFVETFGRAPDERDSEELRMHTHLAWIRSRLGDAPATSPALEGRRAGLLGYLDDYIAKGVTPQNTYVPWRSPRSPSRSPSRRPRSLRAPKVLPRHRARRRSTWSPPWETP